MNTHEFVYKYDKRYNIKDLEFILDYKKINIENISIPKINCMNNLLNLTSIDFKFNLLQNINDYILYNNIKLYMVILEKVKSHIQDNGSIAYKIIDKKLVGRVYGKETLS